MLTLQLLINGLAAGALAAPVAMGFSLILGVQRFWHLAHGAVYVWVTYIGYLILRAVPLWIGLAAAPLVGAALGVILEVTLYSGLRARGTSPLVMFVGSLGVYIAATNVAALVFGFDPKIADQSALSGAVLSGSLTITVLQVAMVVVGVASLLAMMGTLATRGVGLEVRAMLADTDMASLIGVRIRRTRVFCMAVGSALLAIPAMLTMVSTGADPNAGLNVVLIAAIAAIVGGLGSVVGAFFGALIIGVASTVPLAYISTQWQQAIAFGILVVMMLVRPTGFSGQVIWKTRT